MNNPTSSENSSANDYGSLTIVGIGPGAPELMTLKAATAISSATDLIGYDTYINRLPDLRPDQTRHASANGVELDRAGHALKLAGDKNRNVVVVSGGDPGVFAMASAVFEAIERGPERWRNIDVHVEPGITAMLAASAHLGAPLGGDFCAISLSDNLKSWSTIERRLEAAAKADFVIALYNPSSKARPHQIKTAFEIVARHKPGETLVAMVRAAGASETISHISTLADVDPGNIDMRTLVFIGATSTTMIVRKGKAPWVYTPRSERGSP